MPLPSVHGRSDVVASLHLEEAGLAWAPEFLKLLPDLIRRTNEIMREFGEETLRRTMHERFQQLTWPRHQESLEGVPRLPESIHGMVYSSMAFLGGGFADASGVHLEVGRGVPYALQREMGGTIVAGWLKGAGTAVNGVYELRGQPFLVFRTYQGSLVIAQEVEQEGSHYMDHTAREMWAITPGRYLGAVRAALSLAVANTRALEGLNRGGPHI